jgi:hypothetical protein
MSESPIFCDRCAAQLEPGRGQLYVIKIEALADPTPPNITREDLSRDIAGEIERLLEEMSDVSGQEALDQVYRRLTIYLCNTCYQSWIENPTGNSR